MSNIFMTLLLITKACSPMQSRGYDTCLKAIADCNFIQIFANEHHFADGFLVLLHGFVCHVSDVMNALHGKDALNTIFHQLASSKSAYACPCLKRHALLNIQILAACCSGRPSRPEAEAIDMSPSVTQTAAVTDRHAKVQVSKEATQLMQDPGGRLA